MTMQPVCFGTYNPESPRCLKRCAWRAECKAATETTVKAIKTMAKLGDEENDGDARGGDVRIIFEDSL